MFSVSRRKNSKILVIALFVLALAIAGGWFAYGWLSDRLLQDVISILPQSHVPDRKVSYAAAKVDLWSSSVFFDDLSVIRGNNNIRIKNLALRNIQRSDGNVAFAKIEAQNFGMLSGSRNFSGDIKFDYVADADKTSYHFNDFYFEDLATKSTVKWQSVGFDNVARQEVGVIHYDFAAKSVEGKIYEDGKPTDVPPVDVKFTYDFSDQGLNLLQGVLVTDQNQKQIFAIDKISSQLGDNNFAFLVENLNFGSDMNLLSALGYPKMALNFAATGKIEDNIYQIRTQITMPEAFILNLWVNLDPAIVNLWDTKARAEAAVSPAISSGQIIRQMVLQYSDQSLLQRVYAKFGADQIKMSGQQAVDNLAQVYGLNKNPVFAPSLAALQNFIQAPNNIRVILQPKADVDMAKILGLALANPVELALQLQLQIQTF